MNEDNLTTLYRKAKEKGLLPGQIKRKKENKQQLIDFINGDLMFVTPEPERLAKTADYNTLLNQAREAGFVKKGRPSKLTLAAYIYNNETEKDKVTISKNTHAKLHKMVLTQMKKHNFNKTGYYKYEATYRFRNTETNEEWNKTVIHFLHSTVKDLALKMFELDVKEKKKYTSKIILLRTVKRKVFGSKKPTTIDMKNVKMKRAAPTDYRFIKGKVEYNDSEKGMCVYDYIEREYKVSPMFLKKMVSQYASKHGLQNVICK